MIPDTPAYTRQVCVIHNAIERLARPLAGSRGAGPVGGVHVAVSLLTDTY